MLLPHRRSGLTDPGPSARQPDLHWLCHHGFSDARPVTGPMPLCTLLLTDPKWPLEVQR
jgi:hypothetical protein